MKLLTLPPTVTRYLNALRADAERDLESEDFEQERLRFLDWMELQSSFKVDTEEEAAFENLTFLWQQIDQALATADVENLARHLVEAYALRARIQSSRLSSGLAANENVNSAILAGYAFVKGRTSRETMQLWLEQLERYLNAAWEKAVDVGLPATESGPTAFAQGIQEWRERISQGPASQEAWEPIFTWLRVGARGIEAALDLSSAQGEGSLATPNLDDLRRSLTDQESLAAALDRFAESWQEHLEQLIVTGEQRDELAERMDELLDELESLGDEDATLVLEQIEQAWGASSLAHLQRPWLPAAEEGLLEAISGVLRQTVPDLIAADYLQHCQEHGGEVPAASEHARLYLQDGNIDHLHQAIDRLLAGACASPAPNDANPVA